MNPLDRALKPRSVAVVGASPDPTKWGHVLLANIIDGQFPGPVYPVNPRADHILGLPTFPSVSALPEPVDLAVVAVPAQAVPAVIEECAAAGVGGVVIVSAGLGEAGDDGAVAECALVELARRRGMPIVGPNCNGLANPSVGLQATLARMSAPPGPFAVVSQSGNIAQQLTVGATARGFGISRYISSGNEADQGAADYLTHLEDDPLTRVVLLYAEGFRDGHRLFDVARRVSARKPVVLLKAGVTEAGAQAAQSHTAVLAAADAVVDAFCKQTGVVRVDTLEDLLDTGLALASQPLPAGNRVGVLTAGGGYGVLVADTLARLGVELPALSEATLARLARHLPPRWPRHNPVDKSGLVAPGSDIRIVEALLDSDDVDGVVTLGVPIATMGESMPARLDGLAEFLKQANALRDGYGKPVLVMPTWSLLAPAQAAELTRICRDLATPTFATLTGIASAYAGLVRYARHRRDRVPA